MENPFNLQSKKNVYTFIYMWFIGFMVKDTTAVIAPYVIIQSYVLYNQECRFYIKISGPKI